MERKQRIEELKARLTVKQAAFAEEFLVDLNRSKAALRAGYSDSSAGTEGSRLMQKAGIAELVELLKLERSEATEVTAARVVAEIAKMAFADPHAVKFIKDPDGKDFKLTLEIDEKTKLKALELLGKHTAAFTENLNLTTNGKDLPAAQTVVNVAINHRRRASELTKPSDEDLLA